MKKGKTFQLGLALFGAVALGAVANHKAKADVNLSTVPSPMLIDNSSSDKYATHESVKIGNEVVVRLKNPTRYSKLPNLTGYAGNVGMSNDSTNLIKLAYYGNQLVAQTDYGWTSADNIMLDPDLTDTTAYNQIKSNVFQLQPKKWIERHYYTKLPNTINYRIKAKKNVGIFKTDNVKAKKPFKTLKKGKSIIAHNLIFKDNGTVFETANGYYVTGNKKFVSMRSARVNLP